VTQHSYESQLRSSVLNQSVKKSSKSEPHQYDLICTRWTGAPLSRSTGLSQYDANM